MLPGKCFASLPIRPEGLPNSLGSLRTLPHMVKDAAQVETPFLRAIYACYGYLVIYNLPLAQASASLVGAPHSSDPQPPAQWSAQSTAPLSCGDAAQVDGSCPS